MAKSVWKDYFEQLGLVFQTLQGQTCHFSKNAVFTDSGLVNKYHRGVYQLTCESAQQRLSEQLHTAEELYYHAVKNDTAYANKAKGLPINFPRKLDGDIEQIQIHVNTAHQSLKYPDDKRGEYVPVARYTFQASSDPTAVANKAGIERLMVVKEGLEALGFDVKAETVDISLVLKIPAKVLAQINLCQYIQHRVHTGDQVRANFYRRGEDGLMAYSDLQSLGVVYIADGQPVRVEQSAERKIRQDNLYLPKQPKEIVLDCIPNDLQFGRLFRR